MSDTAPNPNQHDAGDDSLASLHRMSTTAGVSSQEYVAVNFTSVAAVLAGLAGALVFLSPLWLGVPAIAIVLGLVALRQISHSNGTQTGRLLAWAGIVLAVGIIGFQLGVLLVERAKQRPLKAEVLVVCDTLEQSIIKEDYQKAWTLFSDRFRAEKKVDYKAFARRWGELQTSPAAGKIKSLKSNGLVEVYPSQVVGTMLLMEWSKMSALGRYSVLMRKHDGVLQIDDIPLIFAAPPPPQGDPQGGAPGGPMTGPQ